MEKEIQEKYTKKDFNNLHKQLRAISDEKYRKFNESLTPGSEGQSYGVRVPVIRSIARDILKKDWSGFLEYAKKDKNYEIIMLHGMVVALAKIPFDEKLKLFADYIPRINNWAFCDIICGDLKDVKKHREEAYEFLKPYLHSDREFHVRVAVVLLLQYYLVDEYIDRVIDNLIQVKQSDYYVKMAVAWAMSMCYVKFPEKTYPILAKGLLDEDTHNKTMQKIRDSHQVSREQKESLRRLAYEKIQK